MAEKRDRNVPMTPVRDADRACRALGLPLAAPRRAARVAELRRQVHAGYYATESMMDTVARLLLRSSDL
jgi:hypothetical protein